MNAALITVQPDVNVEKLLPLFDRGFDTHRVRQSRLVSRFGHPLGRSQFLATPVPLGVPARGSRLNHVDDRQRVRYSGSVGCGRLMSTRACHAQ